MKWPNTLTVVRHGESDYNRLKLLKEQDPKYKEFKSAFNGHRKSPDRAKHAAELANALLEDGTYTVGVSDFNTPLTSTGEQQSETTGRALKGLIDKPDVILVSPYLRTVETLRFMAIGWPALKDVKTVQDDRLREQEHGLANLYNDWRIFTILHPEQERLRDQEGPYWYRYPQGENVPDIRERNRSLLGTITRDYREQNVLVVTHHLSILALRANLERLDDKEYLMLDTDQKPINCGATIYKGQPDQGKNGKLVLDVYNQKLY